MKEDLYMGLDLSTQSLTVLIINSRTDMLQVFSIGFDESYPSYGTQNGFLINDDPGLVHVDPLMWVEAFDDMMQLLYEKGLTSKIAAIGVSAQQHGTVYLNKNVGNALSRLRPSDNMLTALKHAFSRETCPIWMDSSTAEECIEIAAVLCGDEKVAHLTGSITTERFAGPQIRRFMKKEPEKYKKTSHITLISSFITALLVGHLVSVDAGDGFGTNLADIRRSVWCKKALNATAPELEYRLPSLLKRDEVVGCVSPYMVKKYGFRPDTCVIVGSGDNPCSLVGLGLIGELEVSAISLGTSDTYFGYMAELSETKRETGHIFGTADGNYMFLICFKNGSLAREKVKRNHRLTWNDFSRILAETQPGNQGRIMLPYFFPEITPKVLEPGVKRFGGLDSDDAMAEVRAITEAQAMAMFIHSDWTGFRPQTILVTGGGSENIGMLKVISHVYGAEVRTLEVKNSAALGAAVRASYVDMHRKGIHVSWKRLVEPYAKDYSIKISKPSRDKVEIYQHENGLISVYRACEAFALGREESPETKIAAFRHQFEIR